MPNAIGSAFIAVKPDTRGFEAGARAGVLGPLKKVAVAAAGVFAGIEIGRQLKDSIKEYSDEVAQAYRTTHIFGGSAEVVKSFADSAASSFGLAEKDALGFTNQLGQMFVQMGLSRGKSADMSVEFVKLAANMASFANVPVENAVSALQRGLAGATRGLKQFGIVIDQNQIKAEAVRLGLIKTVKDALDPATKAQATYALILSQSGLVQDDFQKRSGNLRNTMLRLNAEWANAKEAIGRIFLPILLTVLGFLANTLPSTFHGAGAAIRAFSGLVSSALTPIRPLFEAAFYGFTHGGVAGAINATAGALTKLVPQFEPVRHAIALTVGEAQQAGRAIARSFADFTKARSAKARLDVVVSGLEAAKRGVQAFFFGTDKLVRDHQTLGLFQKVHVPGIVDDLQKALSGVNFTGIGRTVGTQLAGAIKTGFAGADVALTFSDKAVAGLFAQLLAQVNANAPALGQAGAVIALNLVSSLLDPGFWKDHWQLGLSIAIAVIPTDILVSGGIKIIGALLRPFSTLGARLGVLLSRALGDAALGISGGAERLGVAVGDAIAKALSSGARGVGDLASLILRPLGTLGTGIASLLDRALASAASGAGRAAQSLGRNIGTTILSALTSAGRGVESAGASLGSRVADGVLSQFKRLPGVVRAALKVGVIDAVITAGAAAAAAAVNLAGRLASGIQSGLKKLPGIVKDQMSTSVKDVAASAGQFFSAAVRVAERLAAGIKTAPGKLAGLGGDLGKAVVTAAAGALQGAVQAGVEIAQGIAQGIYQGIPAIIKAAGSAAAAIPGKIASLLHIHSPSRVMADTIGRPIAEGVAVGMAEGTAGIAQAGVNMFANFSRTTGTAGTQAGAAAGRKTGAAIGPGILWGYLQGTRNLSNNIRASLQKTIDDMRNVITAQRQTVSDAFGTVADKAFQAFDAKTQAGLDSIQAQFDKLRTGVDNTLSGGFNLDAITKSLEDAHGNLSKSSKALIADLTAQFNALPEAVRKNVAAGADALKSAFDTQMKDIDDALTARNSQIDTALQSALSGVDTWLQQQTDAVNTQLQAQLAAIDAWQKQLTPTEQIIKDQQAAHDAAQAAKQLADAQQGVADAQNELNAAQAAGTDPQAILDAQKKLADAQAALADVQFQQQIAAEQTQADTERQQRDAQAEQERKDAQDQADKKLKDAKDQADVFRAQDEALAAAERAQAQADHDAAAALATANYNTDLAAVQAFHDAEIAELESRQKRADIEYQAERDLLKEHLQLRLAALERHFELEKNAWKTHGRELLTLFHTITGSYSAAGAELGNAFITGLNESIGRLRGAAEHLAEEIAKYLKLHSPAEKGPLSDLDKWWKPFAPTLMKGLDVNAIGLAGRGPQFSSSASVYGAPGDPAVLRKLDELKDAIKEHRDGDLTVVAATSVGGELNDLAARLGG